MIPDSKPSGSSFRSIGPAYIIDHRDTVRELTEFPQSSVGSPMPVVLANEHELMVLYLLESAEPDRNGATCDVITPDSFDELFAVVRFKRARAHFFGPPNDEAFGGYPLAERGLEPYSVFEVLSSSWIRALEQMNSVHPQHRPESFESYRHFILAFHDTTFECIADGFTIEQLTGTMRSITTSLAASL